MLMRASQTERSSVLAGLRTLFMRFSAPAIALSTVLAVSASVSHSALPDTLSPRAAALEVAGRAALAAGKTEAATDAFEAALALEPGSHMLVIDLADAARADGLQGKAIHYYRVLLSRDPNDVGAISGEGAALAEKGAVAKAQANLARLKALCGSDCPATGELAAVLAKVAPDAVVGERRQTAMVGPEALVPKPTAN